MPWIFVNRAVYKVLLRFLCSPHLRAVERWAAKICIGRDWRRDPGNCAPVPAVLGATRPGPDQGWGLPEDSYPGSLLAGVPLFSGQVTGMELCCA